MINSYADTQSSTRVFIAEFYSTNFSFPLKSKCQENVKSIN